MLAPWSWTLNFQNCEKISFCHLSHPVNCIALGQPEDAKTHHQLSFITEPSNAICTSWTLYLRRLRHTTYPRSLPGCLGLCHTLKFRLTNSDLLPFISSIHPVIHSFWDNLLRACYGLGPKVSGGKQRWTKFMCFLSFWSSQPHQKTVN